MADKDGSLGWIIIIYNVYCTFLLSKNICLKCTCKLYCIWITQLVAPCATFQQYFDTAFKSFKEQALRPAGPLYNCKITVLILTYNLLIWFVNSLSHLHNIAMEIGWKKASKSNILSFCTVKLKIWHNWQITKYSKPLQFPCETIEKEKDGCTQVSVSHTHYNQIFRCRTSELIFSDCTQELFLGNGTSFSSHWTETIVSNMYLIKHSDWAEQQLLICAIQYCPLFEYFAEISTI